MHFTASYLNQIWQYKTCKNLIECDTKKSDVRIQADNSTETCPDKIRLNTGRGLLNLVAGIIDTKSIFKIRMIFSRRCNRNVREKTYMLQEN